MVDIIRLANIISRATIDITLNNNSVQPISQYEKDILLEKIYKLLAALETATIKKGGNRKTMRIKRK